MALENFTYDSILSATITKIVNLCDNVSRFSTIPAEFKDGYVFNQDTFFGPNKTTTVYTINNTTVISHVPEATVLAQLTDFLTARGIISKQNDRISTKGIINFYNNISSFCSVKLKICASQLSNTKLIIYDSFATDFPPVTNVTEDYSETVLATTYSSMLESLNTSLISKIKLKQVLYNISFNSSSCSSSCSSSSSSSCSSAFIAYKQI